ncbi:O-antigen ligase family protein [Campylobacter sp. RM12327]|uniref:O-antigen ligase family protein n=1 Tax=Campylobacter sputorum TaxID=206 RepID=UPI000B775C3D|nr:MULTISPECIES: O-antigen ligase family protein [Campylobacter]ASM40011.1 putative membrane protein, putative O-glycosylation ligase [Campylobacter sputorum]MBE7357665.1 O-antigen ligase family protein [Campylobacter sp. RM11302]MBF6669310.1 O-antigen ligase family protein [Campylobacter sp. RM12327]MBF6674579.1 O-antigen ligase family protein [Campylobacter sp. RM13538]MBF6676684.1 O-antigen ligase family protein [Campylobacter sp. RM12321]
MSEYILSLKADKTKFAFKFLLFVWLCSVPFKNSIYQISTVLILLFCIIHFIKNKNYFILKENFNKTKILSFFVGLIILSMIVSNLLNLELATKDSWKNTFSFIYRYAFIFIALAYFYALSFFSKKEMVFMLLFGTMLLALSGICEAILNPNVLFGNVSNGNTTGLRGTLNNRNIMGLMMSVSVVFSLFVLRKNLLISFVLLAIYGFCMIFSFSRSGWVASGVAFLIFITLNFKKFDKRFFIVVILFIAAVILIYLNVDSFQTRFNQLLAGQSSYRTYLWKYGISQIINQPFFGHGVSIWRSLDLPPDIALHTGVHNSTIEILLFTGIFGLFVWISAVFLVFFEILKSKNFIYLPLLAYFVVITQFDFSVFDSKELFSYVSVFLFLVYSDKFKENF